MKTKKLIKRALKRPELFTEGELHYFKLMERQRKLNKKKQKAEAAKQQSDYLL